MGVGGKTVEEVREISARLREMPSGQLCFPRTFFLDLGTKVFTETRYVDKPKAYPLMLISS